ncbi:MAG TPA: homoserine kinase [Acidimicrobiia bacterium]|nr:homoserine kinase [Acidimicrobiia bacterium]
MHDPAESPVPPWRVRVPASSANLGAAFDAVALALDLPLEVAPAPEGSPDAAPAGHPAVKAFRSAGGRGQISVHARFPGGRGLGFSGAARVAGLVAADAQRGAREPGDVLGRATELEGHADNVAASITGGVVAVAGGRVTSIPLGCALAVVLWIPDRETATDHARRSLPDAVSLADASFNIGRTALLVAALAAGDVDALRIATEDRLHQDRRLAHVPATRAAMEAALAGGAYAAWLSGSGPSAAAFAAPDHAGTVASGLPSGGRALVVGIASAGATIMAPPDLSGRSVGPDLKER